MTTVSPEVGTPIKMITLDERFQPLKDAKKPSEEWVLSNVGKFTFQTLPNESPLAERFQSPRTLWATLKPDVPEKAEKWASFVRVKVQVFEGDWYLAKSLVNKDGDVVYFWEEPPKSPKNNRAAELLSVEDFEAAELGFMVYYRPIEETTNADLEQYS